MRGFSVMRGLLDFHFIYESFWDFISFPACDWSKNPLITVELKKICAQKPSHYVATTVFDDDDLFLTNMKNSLTCSSCTPGLFLLQRQTSVYQDDLANFSDLGPEAVSLIS